MVEKKAQKMQHIQYWSSCSNQFPSGRFRKVSIGIMSETYPNMGSLAREEYDVALPDRRRSSSLQGKVLEENDGGLVKEYKKQEKQEDVGSFPIKQAEYKDQIAPARFSTRSVGDGTPTTKFPVQPHMNGASPIQSEDDAHKKAGSLCRDQYPSGHFSKVSIGIMVETHPKTGSLVREDDGVALLNKGRISSLQGKVIKVNEGQLIEEIKKSDTLGTFEMKQAQHEHQRAPAWFSSGSIHHETPKTECLFQFHMNQESLIQSENNAHKKPDKLSYVREEKGENISRLEEVVDEFTDDPMKETELIDKRVEREESEKVAKCNNEALKTKLWEVLGTAPSQYKHIENSPNIEDGKENLNINHKREYHRSKVLQPKNTSDTIDTGSTNPNQTTRRPITSSLIQRRNLPKTVSKSQSGINIGKKTLCSSVTDSKLHPKENNIFSFDEEEKVESLGRTVSGYSNKSKGVRYEQKTAGNEMQRVSSHKPLGSQGLQPDKKEKMLPSPDDELLSSKESGVSPSLLRHGTADSMQRPSTQRPYSIYVPGQLIPEKELQPNERKVMTPSPDSELLQNSEAECSPSPFQSKKDSVQIPISQKLAIDPSLRQMVSEKNFQPNGREQIVPLPQRASVLSKQVPIDSHHTQKVARQDFENLLFTDNAENREIKDGPLMRKKKHSRVPNDPSLPRKVASPQLERKTDLLDDFSSPILAMNATPSSTSSGQLLNVVFSSPVLSQSRILKGKDYSLIFNPSRTGSHRSDLNQEFSDDNRMVHRSQDAEFQHVKGKKTRKESSLSPMEEQYTDSFEADDIMTEGTDEASGSFRASEQYLENSLESDVVKLALILERFKTKLNSHTSSKISEVLSAAAGKISLELQDLESQMQADVGKFINTGNSKRKRLESRFQEQQERLRLLHDKFKEEIPQQIQELRSTLEELEAHQKELKGSTYRLKASYRKLLLQVQEVMNGELRDAEMRIAAIDKEARKKMFGLKHVLKQWIEDGVY